MRNVLLLLQLPYTVLRAGLYCVRRIMENPHHVQFAITFCRLQWFCWCAAVSVKCRMGIAARCDAVRIRKGQNGGSVCAR